MLLQSIHIECLEDSFSRFRLTTPSQIVAMQRSLSLTGQLQPVNPVQISAKGTDPVSLKAKYGNELVFWGGGVDTQLILPFEKPEKVRNQVLRTCEIFNKNGGFVFNTVHNIQANVPVENVVAMIDAISEFNRNAAK